MTSFRDLFFFAVCTINNMTLHEPSTVSGLHPILLGVYCVFSLLYKVLGVFVCVCVWECDLFIVSCWVYADADMIECPEAH